MCHLVSGDGPLDMAFIALNAAKVLKSLEREKRPANDKECEILEAASGLFKKLIAGSRAVEGKKKLGLTPDLESIAGVTFAISSLKQLPLESNINLTGAIMELDKILEEFKSSPELVELSQLAMLREFLLNFSNRIAGRLAQPTERLERHRLFASHPDSIFGHAQV